MRFLRQMFGPSPTPLRARLTLEALDGRLPPSTITGTGTDPLDSSALVIPVSAASTTTTSSTPSTSATPTNAAVTQPQIINFTWSEGTGGIVTFTGQVIDPAPGGLTVSFGGDPESLQGVKTTTDANGNFSKTLIMKTNGTDNGTATAQTTDKQGLQSNIAMTYVIV
ncbi:hypothetical protein [Frigoriglobus tundricola]|uniref:Uncharacterized protein n=1 Tax=Frigoriglobus tundricola TaxID=2774151 RepID=A0A6M5YZN6_9BACT|nr:hypothetical protein [Frigoriglobus tundricola]QJW99415.1 hypothetical protein FTUN_7027 [Frigoriglobus tundricola]